MTEVEKLKRAIAHLEAQRDILGEDSVQAASAVLLQRLADLSTAQVHVSRREQRWMSSRLIGRQAELRAIRRRVERMLKGQGRFISVIGEAGIGKSRLIAELRNQVLGPDLHLPVQWLEASASSMGKVASYWLFRQLIWAYAGISEQDNDSDVWDKLRVRVGALFEDSAAQILPFLATMISLDVQEEFAEGIQNLSGEAMRRQVLLSSRLLFERIAQTQALVLVFEDVQWIDESSVDLLLHLLPLMYHAPVLLLGVSRPALEGPPAQLLQRLTEAYHDRYDEIRLKPLSPPQSAKLVANLLRNELPPAFHDKIIAKAQGNPFFIEEIIRSLIDEGLLYRDSSSNEWRIATEIETMSVPRTIQDTIMARVGLLDEPLKEAVKVAAVVGRRFLYRLLLAVVQPAPELREHLALLERLGLIVEDTRTPELAYMFNHDLAQEAIYENVDDSERKILHAQVGSAIEQLFADRLEEFFGFLAYHYSRAEEWEKAQDYLFKAGDGALRSAASNEALHYYQGALSIYRRLRGANADPEKVAVLEKNIGLALFNRGYYAEAVEHFDEALTYFRGEFPQNALSTSLRLLSSLITFLLALYFPRFWFKKIPTSQDVEAVDLFYKKAEALVVLSPARFFVESLFFYNTIIHLDLTRFRFGIGIFAGASALFSFSGLSFSIGKRILDYAKPRLASDEAKQLIVYDFLHTQHLFLVGQWNEIAECDGDLVNRILRAGEMWAAVQDYFWHGLSKIYQGHFDSARRIVTKMTEIAESYENDIYRLFKCLLNSCLLIECRHMKEAAAEVNRGMEAARKRGWGEAIFTMNSLEALIHLLMAKPEDAAKSLDQANGIRSEAKLVPLQLSAFYRSEFEYYLRRLEDSLRSGQKGEAAACRRNAFKSGKLLIKACQKAAQFRTTSYRLMGVYYWLIDDQKRAFKWWHKAIREGESLGARPQQARAYAEMGIRSSGINGESSEEDASSAREHLKKARTMFRDLGLHHDLETSGFRA
jgi:tetratricopeptide (TPR) repeat protein